MTTTLHLRHVLPSTAQIVVDLPAVVSGKWVRDLVALISTSAPDLLNPAAPSLAVVTAMQSVDMGALRTCIETEALTHARQVLDRPDLPIQLDLDVSRKTPERTR